MVNKVKVIKEIIDPEYIEEKEIIKTSPTSGGVYLHKKHIGKKAIIIIEKEKK